MYLLTFYSFGLILKALSKFVTDNILKLILMFFRENKLTFHINCLSSRPFI